MGKTTIHCVRHAQGYHNLNEANHQIHDPDLTTLGEQQCATLSQTFPYHSKVTHLVASPLRRTLYTCLLSFPAEVQAGLKVAALPELQETSDLPCDTGSEPSVLAAEFASGKFAGSVDLELVKEGWNNKQGRWSPAGSAIEARARDARIWLRNLAQSTGGDADIAVVTHGGYLHYFTEDWEGNEKFTGTGWANTEFRSYEFLSATDEAASLVETRESRERRKGTEKPLSADEQRELKAAAEREWRDSGFQSGSGAENAKL
ncbi:Phosphoglycerate mutase [Hyphodiscus hymeniophilus]|uniref:Phosphoglycerate mutase n=1 Tax=Hyphodiscus hymeniophilus TaxID=353542 RepID=A0A9P6VPN7_9HELO|nr:Phosphoglycerate mutase [Hyphodiscus hymeniophilus]